MEVFKVVRLLGMVCWMREGLEADERNFQVMAPYDRMGRGGVERFH